MRLSDFPVLSEIKEEYAALREGGCSRSDAVCKLKMDYRNELEIGSDDDGVLVCIGLADAQYKLKELDSETAAAAVSALDKLESRNLPIAKSDLIRRREWYSKAPMPERKKVRSAKKYRCEWKIGDTFAYQLCGEEAVKNGHCGKYVIFRKVSEIKTFNGHTIPIITMSSCDSEQLPRTAAEFENCEIMRLRTAGTKNGRLMFDYRIGLVLEKEADLQRLNLQYLGCFPDGPIPEDEVVIDFEAFMLKVFTDQIDWLCCRYLNNQIIYKNMIKA